MNLEQIEQDAITIVRRAGDTILSYFQDAFTVKDKSPDNPVTDADLAADQLLKEALTALLPQAGWLSEETVDHPDRLDKEYVWVVDPLDGTKEFVMGIPEFTVSVGLVQNGRPVLGIIFNPPKNEMFSGYRGGGIRFNGDPAAISSQATFAGSTIDASRSEMKRNEFAPFADQVTLITMGSIAYKLARVAVGIADATWSRGPKNEWDICAGVLLLEEGGGFGVNLDNDPFMFNQPRTKVNGIIAGNKQMQAEIIAKLAPYRQTART